MAPKHKAAPESLPEPSKRARALEPGASTTSPDATPVPVDPPAAKPPAPAATSVPGKPAIPSCLDADVDAMAIIRSVILYVKYYLLRRLKDDEAFAQFPDVPELAQHQPLPIKETTSKTELLSYKAPWDKGQATTSLETTLMYESSGNMLWVNPFPASPEEKTVAGENPSWAMVDDMANLFRFRASTPGDAGGVARDMRIVFPVTLCVSAKKAADLAGDTFPGTLRAVTGHTSIYGWFLAMYEALENGPGSWVKALWQAALKVTIQSHVIADMSSLAVLSMQKNNDLRVNAKVLTDSFPAFARKMAVALKKIKGTQNRLNYCTEHGIRFNNTIVHRTLLSAATTYTDRVDDDTHALLMRLEHKFGPDLLTGQYNSLTRILQICSKEIDMCAKMWDGASTPDLLGHVIRFIMWALAHEKLHPGGVTCDWLDKSRDGTPGCIARVLAKMQLVMHCRSLVSELPDGSATRAEMLRVLDKFSSYTTYGTAFGARSTPASKDEDAKDPYESFRETLSKTGVVVLDFLFDLFAGDLDKDLDKMVQKHGCEKIGLLEWSSLAGDAGKKWREISRQLGLNKSTVSAFLDGSCPPAATSRQLKRSLSCGDEDPDDRQEERTKEIMQERAETWKNAQTSRKRRANTSVTHCKSVAGLQRWWEKQKEAYEYTGKAGEAHRVFVFSADTFGTEGKEPWGSTAPNKDMTAVLEWMARQTGPSDVLLSFDGRNGSNRKAMGEIMENTRHVCELWVVYEATKRLGRRVAWASDTREVAWLSLPVPRTAIATKERADDAKEWAADTHMSFYTNVPQAPWESLPLISKADKQRVMGDEPEQPPLKIFDGDRGMPLYWQEWKPVEFWKDILHCLDARMVIDMSPGSGAAGRACLRLGIQYTAACRTGAHAIWLAKVLDRESCELIVTTKSPLFEQDLAQMIKTHFSDVLSQLQEQREADPEPDPEPEEA